MQRNPSTPSAVPASLRCWALAASPSSPPRLNARATATRTSSTGDSYFYYLTGFAEPGAVLVLTAEGTARCFASPRIWARNLGQLPPGPAAAPEALGVNAAPVLCGAGCPTAPPAGKPQLRLVPSPRTGLAARVEGWLNAVRARVRYGTLCPAQQSDVCTLLDEMRLIKDAHEAGHHAPRQPDQRRPLSARCGGLPTCCVPGRILREIPPRCRGCCAFREGGSQCRHGSIVAAGANACVLHYRADAAPVRDGELVLIDAGCRLDGYASDITRTFPANGKFTAPSALYDLVLASQDAAVAATKAGARFNDPHDATVAVLAQNLLDLGLLDKNKVGTARDVIEKRAYFQFYMHRTGHWLGMDVHDCGSYVEPGEVGQASERRTRSRARPSPTAPAACCARHGADHRAWAVRAPRRGRAGTVLEHWHPHRDDAVVTGPVGGLITRDVPVDAMRSRP